MDTRAQEPSSYSPHVPSSELFLGHSDMPMSGGASYWQAHAHAQHISYTRCAVALALASAACLQQVQVQQVPCLPEVQAYCWTGMH